MGTCHDTGGQGGGGEGGPGGRKIKIVTARSWWEHIYTCSDLKRPDLPPTMSSTFPTLKNKLKFRTKHNIFENLSEKYQEWYTIDAPGAIFPIFKYSHFDTLNNFNNTIGSQNTLGSQNIFGSQKQCYQYCQC